jgi:hypothetical protein
MNSNAYSTVKTNKSEEITFINYKFPNNSTKQIKETETFPIKDLSKPIESTLDNTANNKKSSADTITIEDKNSVKSIKVLDQEEKRIESLKSQKVSYNFPDDPKSIQEDNYRFIEIQTKVKELKQEKYYDLQKNPLAQIELVNNPTSKPLLSLN